MQDEFYSEGRGYSAGITAGIGKGFDKNNPRGYGVNLSSVSAGHTRTDVEQRTTRNVTEFTAGAGFLDVKGTVKQVGSLIDGNFTLSSNGYEHEDLKDIDKSRTVGINVTVYPNVSYSQRDKNGNQVYVDGSNPKKTGMAVKTGLTYGETDRTREILATVGAGLTMNHDLAGVNRDPDRQVTEFEGRDLKPVNVDLLAEYWATEAGRGKFRDIVENSARSTQGIINVITRKSESGEYNLIKNIISESVAQKMERLGFIDVKGKTAEQIQKEVEARFGGLTKKGIKVRFYGTEDMDLSGLTKEQINRLMADGFATTGDGYIWINKDRLTNDTIDLNKLIQHELTHQILGEDSEYQARYVEGVYGNFLENIKLNGYLEDTQIVDLLQHRLSETDKNRLNGYSLNEMQDRIFLDSELTIEERNAILLELQEITNYKLKQEGTEVCENGKCGYEVVYDKNKGSKIKVVVISEKDSGGNYIKDEKGNRKRKIVIESDEKKANDYKKGNKLISDLIEKTSQKVFITNEKDNERKERWISKDGSSQRGNLIKINMKDNVKTQVWDEENRTLLFEKNSTYITRKITIPKFLELAHELIHEHHWLFPNYSVFYKDYGANTFYEINKKYLKHYVFISDEDIQESFSTDSSNDSLGGYDAEEIITIGVGNSTKENAKINGIKAHGEYNLDSDITENDIRTEHRCIGINCENLYPKYSFNYRIVHNMIVPKIPSEEIKKIEERLKKTRLEMEGKK